MNQDHEPTTGYSNTPSPTKQLRDQLLLMEGDLLRHTLLSANENNFQPIRFKTPSGLEAELIEVGMLILRPSDISSAKRSMILSSGIHGNEAGPAELCNDIVQKLFSGEYELTEEVMFVVGNPQALIQDERGVGEDLNRLFAQEDTRAPRDSYEYARADTLRNGVDRYWREGDLPRMHLDLHTTRNQSKYQHFGIVQLATEEFFGSELQDILIDAQLSAIILRENHSNVFPYYSASRYSAQAATIELGIGRPLGENRLQDYVAVRDTLRAFLRGDEIVAPPSDPKYFKPLGSIIVGSDDYHVVATNEPFEMREFRPGTVYAQDGERSIVLEAGASTIMFPEIEAKKGERAGVILQELSR